MSIKAISLQSGSNGNCIFVEAGGVRLLFDAGISGVQAERRLATRGVDIRTVDALIVSHDHADHMRSAGVYQRKYKVPIRVTRKTLDAGHRRLRLGSLFDVTSFAAGEALELNGVRVHSLPTPHDAADGLAFVVEHAGRRLGVLTDLGHPFKELGETVATLDAVFIESNYDPEMLENGPYPWRLQQRIRGLNGHLSNADAAELLRRHATPRLKWAALAHLSENNNTPQVALETHRELLGQSFPLVMTSRYEVSEVWEV